MIFIFTTAIILFMMGFCPEICQMIQIYLMPCLCNVCENVAETVIHIVDYHKRLKDARRQAHMEATGKELKRRTETLTCAICEMAKAGVPAETMTEFARSTFGSTTKPDEHILSKIILEALKALSAILKKLG